MRVTTTTTIAITTNTCIEQGEQPLTRSSSSYPPFFSVFISFSLREYTKPRGILEATKENIGHAFLYLCAT